MPAGGQQRALAEAGGALHDYQPAVPSPTRGKGVIERRGFTLIMPLTLMRLVDRLFMVGRLRANLELMGLLERLGERGHPGEANRLLGALTTTVWQWCERQAASRAAG